jgi:hypothetical protein
MEQIFLNDVTNQIQRSPLLLLHSLFRVPWPPEIGARTPLTQHKIDFQHSVFLLKISTKSLCWELKKNFGKHFLKMDELCTCIFHLSCWQPETSKWVRTLDPKQIINYARPWALPCWERVSSSENIWKIELDVEVIETQHPAPSVSSRISKGQGYQGFLRKKVGSSFGQKRTICVIQGKTWKMDRISIKCFPKILTHLRQVAPWWS